VPRRTVAAADHQFADPSVELDVAVAIAIEKEALAQVAILESYVDTYYYDFAGWIQGVVVWDPADPTDRPTAYQLDIARDLIAYHREAGMGPHGLGKTFLMACAVWWFSTTREGAARLGRISDWKILTTAGSWKQLTSFLWPEIRKVSRKIDWAKVGRGPIQHGRELLQLMLQMEYGQGTSVAATDPALIEGAHAPQILFLYDESKAIEARTFDATEGAFSTAGAGTGRDAYALAMSTPGPTEGRFYEIQTDHEKPEEERRFPHWHTRKVTLQETIDAGRNSEQWSRDMARQWGATSSVYINRVLGQFSRARADGIIPYRWVEDAMNRWDERGTIVGARKSGDSYVDSIIRPQGRLRVVGIDPNDSGDDDAYLAYLHDDWVRLESFRSDAELGEGEQDPGVIAIADHAVAEVGLGTPLYVVDSIGVGAGVASYLRAKKKRRVVGFKASERAPDVEDPTKNFGFDSLRSYAWWYLRSLLDPNDPVHGERRIALPASDRLLGDLSFPTYQEVGGRIVVESKKELRKATRLGRSTDAGDAVVMAFYNEADPQPSLGGAKVRSKTQTSRWSPVMQERRRSLRSLTY
jgi:hypothetical protein